jgi:hypothetical protein
MPKNSKTNNSHTAKSSDFVGYEENAVSRGIYRHCGVPVWTVHLRHPDARCIGNMRTGRARPDGLTNHPPGGCRSVRTQSGPVRTIGLHPRPDSKRVLFGPLICPDVNGDHPNAPH